MNVCGIVTSKSWLREMPTPICAIASRVLIVSFQGLSRRVLSSVHNVVWQPQGRIERGSELSRKTVS
jgi:hypothetical protein